MDFCFGYAKYSQDSRWVSYCNAVVNVRTLQVTLLLHRDREQSLQRPRGYPAFDEPPFSSFPDLKLPYLTNKCFRSLMATGLCECLPWRTRSHSCPMMTLKNMANAPMLGTTLSPDLLVLTFSLETLRSHLLPKPQTLLFLFTCRTREGPLPFRRHPALAALFYRKNRTKTQLFVDCVNRIACLMRCAAASSSSA
jgi:hypothetical protein